jgi:hypothetical protein
VRYKIGTVVRYMERYAILQEYENQLPVLCFLDGQLKGYTYAIHNWDIASITIISETLCEV